MLITANCSIKGFVTGRWSGGGSEVTAEVGTPLLRHCQQPKGLVPKCQVKHFCPSHHTPVSRAGSSLNLAFGLKQSMETGKLRRASRKNKKHSWGMVIQGDAALRAHPVPGVNINSLNERGTVSDSSFQVNNKYFITFLSLKKKRKKTLFFSSSLVLESSSVRCAETFLCESGANSPASLPQVLIPSFVSPCGCVSSSLENRAPGIYN